MNSTKAKVKKYFELTARDFDSLYNESIKERLLNRLFRKGVYERVVLTLKEMDPLSGCSILDVGSGSGRNSVFFAQSGAQSVLGIDYSGNMLELARQYAKQNNLQESVKFVEGEFMTAQDLPQADYSVALGVFDYLEDPVSFLKRMKSLTKSKVIASFPGKSLIREPFRKFRYGLRGCPLFFYSHAQLKKIFEDAGFAKYEITPYSSGGFMGVGYSCAES